MGRVPRILIIRGGAIGDFVLTLPAIRLLRESFPRRIWRFWATSISSPLPTRRYYADASRSIEYGPLAGFFVPGGDLDGELAEYFASFQQIVSYLYDPDAIFEKNLRARGVENLITGSPIMDDSEHACYQLARPLQALALYLDDAVARLYPNSEDRAFAQTALEGYDPFVAIHPGSGGERKNWSVENWISLCARMADEWPHLRLLLLGGEADHARLATIEAALARHPPMSLKDLPLPRLAAVIERCALFIGHDSGVSHIAAGVQAPCVLLFGPTDPEIWAPLSASVRVVRAPGGDLPRLLVDSVLAEVAGMEIGSPYGDIRTLFSTILLYNANSP